MTEVPVAVTEVQASTRTMSVDAHCWVPPGRECAYEGLDPEPTVNKLDPVIPVVKIHTTAAFWTHWKDAQMRLVGR